MICEYCKKIGYFKFKNGVICCSKSVSGCSEIQRRKKETCKLKYGDENFKNPIKNKKTKQEKYGNASFNNRDKAKKTLMNTYGVDNISKVDKIKLKKTSTYDKNYRQNQSAHAELVKRKQSTWQEKDINQINKKRENSCVKKFGVSNPLKVKEIANSVSIKNKKNSSTRIAKGKQTLLEKYGVEHISLVPEIHERQQLYKTKEYTMPSGKIIKIQGYEGKALDLLLKEVKECDLITSKKEIPCIHYEYEGKKRRYYPDIYIISDHKIIEVKSEWTFSVKKMQHYKKRDACIDQGYQFEFWIFDTKNNLRIEF